MSVSQSHTYIEEDREKEKRFPSNIDLTCMHTYI